VVKAPAFQFYADDFLSGTITMTDAEVGLYIRLLCHQWNSGGLPNDPAEIELHSRGGTPLKRVLAKFQVGEDGLFRNARMEEVRAQQNSHREKQSRRGAAGAAARWSDAQAMPKQCPSNAQAMLKHDLSIPQALLGDGSVTVTPTPTPTPTPTTKKNNTHLQSGEDLAAEEIYQAYPRKVAKAEALRAIKKAMKDSPVTDLLEITKLFAASQTPGSPFTPYPASWFNGRRYEDDPSAWVQVVPEVKAAVPAWKLIKDLEGEEQSLSGQLVEYWDREANPAGVARLVEVRAKIREMKGQPL
jgi:uncharacterized protein YdaU (DUF1376 family)